MWSTAFGRWPLLTLINNSLSKNFLGVFPLSFCICVHSRNTDWQRCVKISWQTMSAFKKSYEAWPLTFWPKVRHVAPSFHVPLEYEVRSLSIETFIAVALEIMVSVWVIMTLTFKRVTWSSICVFLSCCSTKPNMLYSTIIRNTEQFLNILGRVLQNYRK